MTVTFDGPTGQRDGQTSGPLALRRIPIARIEFNPGQPRRVFDEEDLASLAASIREVGLLQPIVVRPIGHMGDMDPLDSGPKLAADLGHAGVVASSSVPRYQLVAGERRLRAMVSLGWDSAPTLVRMTEDGDVLRLGLLENIQRVQLNPLEEAAALEQLLVDFGCTQEELAQRLGRSRPQIANTLRLLRLPPSVQRRLASGVLSQGHARALLALPDSAAMEDLAARIVAEGLSVRTVEELVAVEGVAGRRRKQRRPMSARDDLTQLSQRLSDRLDTRVSISQGRDRGRLVVEFADQDDLARVLAVMFPAGAS